MHLGQIPPRSLRTFWTLARYSLYFNIFRNLSIQTYKWKKYKRNVPLKYLISYAVFCFYFCLRFKHVQISRATYCKILQFVERHLNKYTSTTLIWAQTYTICRSDEIRYWIVKCLILCNVFQARVKLFWKSNDLDRNHWILLSTGNIIS